MAPYADFGRRLTEYRLAAGIAHQARMAELIGSTQQTLSRWESGQSRPRYKQIGALAKALRVDADELAQAAGYGPTPVVTPYDQPFPIEGLSPTSFERFARHFLKALYPDADVHHEGGAGHVQDGIDIDVDFKNGRSFHFQCKRVQEFGAAKVRAAVRAYKRKAEKKVIFLSRIASPKAREAVREFEGWEIWDKEDVSEQVRSLSKHEQIRLVDIFFPGQRRALLGEGEPNIWQTPEIFFAPFMGRGAFSHDWTLVGRAKETRKFTELLQGRSIVLTLLIGSAGGGKSRVLKHSIDLFQRDNPGVLVRLLSPVKEVTPKSLDDLGHREKILIVDDAHDRQDLSLLFHYVASPENKAKLVLALRPYGLDLAKAQASSFALFGDWVAEIRLEPLSLADATSLAREVLGKSNVPVDAAEDIAKLTLDCPLATAMGAWVVSKQKRHFEFAKNEEAFRTLLMGRFRDVVAGEVSPKDSNSIRKLLNVIAVTQPFKIEDRAFVGICEKVENLSAVEVPRLFRTLVDAGVLFRRGDLYRLSPDLLADFVIESECIGKDGGSTGYAERVFDAADDRLLKQIVVNLGKIDWRRSNGDPSNSRLLDRIWAKLRPTQKYGDPHLEAVKTVAYYQPERALALAENLFRGGEYILELPGILRSVSYSVKYLRPACECLWEIGRNDRRETGPHPEHAIRILADLAAVKRNKPYTFNRIVVEFAISLFDRPDSWTGTYTPLDILKGAIRTEGDTVRWNGPTASLSAYHVTPMFVRPLRDMIRNHVIGLLSNADISIAVRAAAFVQEMIRYPMGLLNTVVPDEVYAGWTDEFVQTLKVVWNAVKSGKLDTLVLLELFRSVSWHATHSTLGTAKVAQSIMGCRPSDFDFRTMVALVDPYGRVFEGAKRKTNASNRTMTDWTKEAKLVAEDLVDKYPDGEALREKIASLLTDIARARMQADPYTLYRELLQRSLGLARATVDAALGAPRSSTDMFATAALDILLQQDREVGLAASQRFLQAGDPALACAAGAAHGWFDFSKDDLEGHHVAIIKDLLSSDNVTVVRSAVSAVDQIAKADRRAALHLILSVDFARFVGGRNGGESTNADQLVNEVFNLFQDGRGLSFTDLLQLTSKRFSPRLRICPRWTATGCRPFYLRLRKLARASARSSSGNVSNERRRATTGACARATGVHTNTSPSSSGLLRTLVSYCGRPSFG